ncbi:Thymidylate kinase [Coemansia sp. S155-1]|nr:Thymidylate kinase [Coemansia sp. S155-1]
MARGLFILFEGCDRSGKTTQSTRLVQALTESGVNAKLVKFPDRTTAIGKMIDGYLTQKTQLSDEAIHLLFSANRWEAMHQMRTDLENGITLVVDRYAFSGVAFSAAKKLGFKWCKAPDVGLIAPDRVFFLDIHPDDAAKRDGYGDEIYEKREFQIVVRVNFFTMMDASWSVVDALRNPDEIHRQVLALTKTALKQHKNAPIGKLIRQAWAAVQKHPLNLKMRTSPASAAEGSATSPSDTVVEFVPPQSSQEAHSAEPSGSYEPLFNFELEPYNMALEIVADALEKLSDTMEPLDLPLPLVGPGYYLEVQVKSPKNAHGSVPFSQINAVTIEGGQAPPVTQVEVILPGESVAHETFMLPVDSISVSGSPTVASESEVTSSLVTQDISPTESVSMTGTGLSIASSSSVASVPLSSTPANIESTSIPLSGASASASNLINSAIEQLYSQGAFDGQASGKWQA